MKKIYWSPAFLIGLLNVKSFGSCVMNIQFWVKVVIKYLNIVTKQYTVLPIKACCTHALIKLIRWGKHMAHEKYPTALLVNTNNNMRRDTWSLSLSFYFVTFFSPHFWRVSPHSWLAWLMNRCRGEPAHSQTNNRRTDPQHDLLALCTCAVYSNCIKVRHTTRLDNSVYLRCIFQLYNKSKVYNTTHLLCVLALYIGAV